MSKIDSKELLAWSVKNIEVWHKSCTHLYSDSSGYFFSDDSVYLSCTMWQVGGMFSWVEMLYDGEINPPIGVITKDEWLSAKNVLTPIPIENPNPLKQWQEEYERLQQVLKTHEANKPRDEKLIQHYFQTAGSHCISIFDYYLEREDYPNVKATQNAYEIGKQLKQLLS